MLLAILMAPLAAAGPKDPEVQKLTEQAIFTDYLGTDFESAKQKLEQATALCADAGACSPAVKANAHRDLGVVLIAGMNDTAGGKLQFVIAFEADPQVALDQDLATEAVTLAFEEARAAAGAPTPAEPPVAAAPAPTQAPPPSPPPAAAQPQQPAPVGQPPAPATSVVSIDAEVCPPDFPGCDDNSQGGAYCESDAECGGGRICINNECSESDSAGPQALNWITLALQQDFLYLGAADSGVCDSDDFKCYNVDGDRVRGSTGGFDGGFVLATTRVVVGYERVVFLPNLTVGLRLGFAFRGAPEDFVPVHAEARAAYWFGTDPLASTGFRPYAFLGGGIGEVDATMPVKGNGGATYDSWRQAGLNFVSAGGGVVFAVDQSFGFGLEAKGEFLFPSSEPGAALLFGGTLGF